MGPNAGLSISHLERVIKSKRPDLLYAVPAFYEKLEAMKSQISESPQKETFGLNGVDFEILYALIPPYDGGDAGDEEVSMIIHYILIIVEIMNDIGWMRPH